MEQTMWTPQMRSDFVSSAVNSTEDRGHQGAYWFNVLPKNTKPDEENPKKAAVTNALMNTIFENPEYRIFALKMYEILINKINSNQFTRQYFQKDIVVMMKGGTSYTYLLGRADETFPYSDLDIVIHINPYLPPVTFNAIKETLNAIVLQTISQYKRAIDFMFFSNKERMTEEQIRRQAAEQFLPDNLIDQFKEDYTQALNAISTTEGTYVSPFEGNEIRNAVSKHSFIIANSNVQENSVVRVELPHFEMCERIPLKKTPMFCSHNSTIDFNRVNNADDFIRGVFDLYRIRFNNLYIYDETTEDGEKKTYRETVTADFIDISIPNQADAELLDFWTHGRAVFVRDPVSSIWILIPDAHTMLNELYKMLTVYECPDAKKDKRQRRYEVLREMMNNYQI